MEAHDLFLAAALQPKEVHSFLADLGFREPERADDHLKRLLDLVPRPEPLAQLAPELLTALGGCPEPDAALGRFESFLEASGTALLTVLLESPSALPTLVTVLGFSPFLTELVQRNPEYFYWLLEQDRLQCKPEREDFVRWCRQATHPFPARERAFDALRRLKRREMLRIGTRDLLRVGTVTDTTEELSDLAESLLQELLRRLRLEEPDLSGSFSVLALGKLGGRELNFSSDVDLIYIFSDSADSEKMQRLARSYTRALSDFSNEGHLYRVDLRLRPMGQEGQIAYSESACRHYYGNWADTSDRVALIKCRPVAGDFSLSKRFLDDLQPFVYRRYLDFAAVDELRGFKSRIDTKLRRQGAEGQDVKLGLGGIREVEFFAQAFQLLYGGLRPELRRTGTLQTLDTLLDGGFIEAADHDQLSRAYIFLRDVEHKLQLVQNLQTHQLPKNEDELRKCARRLNYPDGGATNAVVLFLRDLKAHKRAVRNLFQALLAEQDVRTGLEARLVRGQLNAETALALLKDAGVREPDQVWEGINLLLSAAAFPHSVTRVRNALANLVPLILETCKEWQDPRPLFVRFDRFAEALAAPRSDLYIGLVENPRLASRLFTLLGVSELLSQRLIRNPELFDSLAQSPAYEPDSLIRRYFRQVGERLDPSLLVTIKQHEEFKILLRPLLDGRDHVEARLQLSRLAEDCLRLVCTLVLKQHPEVSKVPFQLFALGKLGAGGLGVQSDLDLMLVFDDRAASPRVFCPLVQRLRDSLQEYTATGHAYRLDFRLRPEGRQAAEATPASSLRSYFKGRAETWERLAYLSARPVFSNRLDIDLPALVFQAAGAAKDAGDLVAIRKRKELEMGQEQKERSYDLKTGFGAMLDIQFIVGYLQLQSKIWEPNILSAISKLPSDRLSEEEMSCLRQSWLFLSKVELIQSVLQPQQSSRLSWNASENDRLAWLSGGSSGVQLLKTYRGTTQRIRDLFDRIFETTGERR